MGLYGVRTYAKFRKFPPPLPGERKGQDGEDGRRGSGGGVNGTNCGANSEEIVDFEERNERLHGTTEGLLVLEF